MSRDLTDWQQRVVEEHKELTVKLDKLESFFTTSNFNQLSDRDKRLLFWQHAAMKVYFKVLGWRIEAF